MLLIFVIAVATARLVAVVEVCRHGARAPTTFYYWDTPALWPEGPGGLTPAGMRQHYLLGQELRRRYVYQQDLLLPNYFQPHIYVFSDDVDRTIMSAQSQLQGLYPNGTGPLLRSVGMEYNAQPPIDDTSESGIIKNLGLNALPNLTQLIPVHSDSQERQYAIGSDDACNYYNILTDERYNTPGYNQIFNNYPDVIQTIMNVMNYSESKAKSKAKNIAGSLTCNQFALNPLPQGFSQAFYNRITQLAADLNNYVNYEPDYTARLAGTGMVTQVLANFQQVMAKTVTSKFFLYSGHDTTILSVLSFLQLNFSSNPVFSSALLFELSEVNGEYFVALNYNDNYQLIPTCGSLNCSFSTFQSYVQSRAIPNYVQVCNMNSSTVSEAILGSKLKKSVDLPGHDQTSSLKWYMWVALVVYIIFMIGFIIAIYIGVKKNCFKSSENDYSIHRTEINISQID